MATARNRSNEHRFAQDCDSPPWRTEHDLPTAAWGRAPRPPPPRATPPTSGREKTQPPHPAGPPPPAVDKSASLREQKPSPSAPSCPPRRCSPAWTTRSPSPRSWTIAIPSTPSLACALIVHDHTETPSAISLKRASTIAEIRMLAWAINAWLLRKAAKVASAQAIVPAQRRRHAFFVSEVTAARLNTRAD